MAEGGGEEAIHQLYGLSRGEAEAGVEGQHDGDGDVGEVGAAELNFGFDGGRRLASPGRNRGCGGDSPFCA